MKRLFDGSVTAHYWQMYLHGQSNIRSFDPWEPFRGQENGLCGARVRGMLFLVTGLHSGHVKVTLDLWEQEPPIDDSWQAWEEIVEASFVVSEPERAGIEECCGWFIPIAIPRGTYRVRYCAKHMDAARARDAILKHEEHIDEYALCLWPAPPAPDRLIKQSSQCAASWHEHARELSAPPAVKPVRPPRPITVNADALKMTDLTFHETDPGEIAGLFAARARTAENAAFLERMASLGITPKSFAVDLDNGHIMSVTCQHGLGRAVELVGFCAADKRTAEVLLLEVQPHFEGGGIGKALLSAIVQELEASGLRELWLVAPPDPQARAHGFYRAQGWRPNGQYAHGREILTLSVPAPGAGGA